MLDPLLQIDTELLIFLNNLGSEQWDSFWFFLTNQFSWSPLFAFLLFLIFKKFGWKNGVLLLLFLIVLITFSDQFTNLIKNTFERLRPCNTEGVIEQIRNFNYKPSSYSFYSGHAASSMTFSFFVILLLKSHFKYIWVLLLFPLLFGYSRIYLGVHYPLDIVSGYFAGIFFGYLFFLLQKKLKLTSRFLKKASI
ncbi:phosphatase PAP2 family protein [Flavobacteriaceae bacterium]|nr:phosphatase PAP2 family protein [Flavobacteriaceae bacterium]MDB2658771.1 phosphatase PAP2 family protein [Flavobacteriaceae bacterium]MDG1160800.1 phosphatase PAP2 family protein [Flavobacteriaceae bacterium]